MELTLKQAQENMRKNNGNLDLSHTDITRLPDSLKVRGWLDLSETKITSLPNDLSVANSLYLSGTKINALPENLKVAGWLDLSHTNITSLPNSLNVSGCLNLSDTPLKSIPEDLIVGNHLYLKGTKITSLPDNFTVGGSLDLRNTPITNLPENLAVGGNLYLDDTNIKKLPKTLKIGGKVFGKQFKVARYKRLKNGTYVPGRYLYSNYILTHVRNCISVDGYFVYAGKIKDKNVISDGKKFACCGAFKDGIVELLYQKSKGYTAKRYRNLTKESKVSVYDAIVMYLVITRVQRQDFEEFVEKQNKLKQEYSVSEIIQLTKRNMGWYRFASFFER